jgi:hypothetical protein
MTSGSGSDLSNVVKLDTPEYAPNQAAIDLIRCIERGEVDAVFIVIRQPDGLLRSWWTRAEPGELFTASTILRLDGEDLLAAEQSDPEDDQEPA